MSRYCFLSPLIAVNALSTLFCANVSALLDVAVVGAGGGAGGARLCVAYAEIGSLSGWMLLLLL